MKEDKNVCSTYVVKTGEHCPEVPTKEISNLFLCEKCFAVVNGRDLEQPPKTIEK